MNGYAEFMQWKFIRDGQEVKLLDDRDFSEALCRKAANVCGEMFNEDFDINTDLPMDAFCALCLQDAMIDAARLGMNPDGSIDVRRAVDRLLGKNENPDFRIVN